MAIKQVRAKINNAWTILTLNESTGNYEATIGAPNVTSYNVNDGHYYPMTIEATNMAGIHTTIDDTNTTFGDDLRLFVKEKIAPVITVVSPTSDAYLSVNTPEIVFTVTDESNGSGVDISTLRFKLDNTTLTNTSSGVTVTTITNGYSIKYVPQGALSDARHILTINCSDHDGNKATEQQVAFKVDTVPPTLLITSPTNNEYYWQSAFSVIGKTSDATSSPVTVTVKVNGVDAGTVNVQSDGNFTKVVTLKEGANTLVITATDKAGKSTTITRTVNLDTSKPEILSVTITPNPVGTGDSFVISVKVE